MPRPIEKLSNCYVPLPLPGDVGGSSLLKDKNNNNGKNILRERRITKKKDDYDNKNKNQHQLLLREAHELRHLYLESSVITSSLGSALVELGHTKVLCEVGVASLSTNESSTSSSGDGGGSTTSTVTGGGSSSIEEGTLQCKVQFAPHIGIDPLVQRLQTVLPIDSATSTGGISMGKLNSQIMSKESDLSYQLSSALLPTLQLDKYPKSIIIIKTIILQDDGSILSACITAATMALIDANIELYDMVTSCTVAIITTTTTNNNNNDDKEEEEEEKTINEKKETTTTTTTTICLADPTQEELSNADATMILAMLPNHKEVTLWSQSGRLTATMANQAMDLCKDGCRTMHHFMRTKFVSLINTIE